jgi:inner membrane protein
MIGWKDPAAPFVFYYYLEHPGDNDFIVQRGRFARWDWEAAKALLRRIKGE